MIVVKKPRADHSTPFLALVDEVPDDWQVSIGQDLSTLLSSTDRFTATTLAAPLGCIQTTDEVAATHVFATAIAALRPASS